MNVLVLGGTRFVGRAIVDELLERGHTVTIAHRGQTNNALFAGRVDTIHLDRLDSLAPLEGQRWDSCVDTCAYVPRAVRMVGEALSSNVGRYLLISTISVYQDPVEGAGEESPLHEVGDPDNEVVDSGSYGFLKVLCEREAERQFPGRCSIIRPGIVIGPHDPTDRFTYWVHRIATELAVLVPDSDSAAQWIDVRDLAWLTVTALDSPERAPINAIGPSCALSTVLDTIRTALHPSCRLVPVNMESHGIEAWSDFPMVTPESDSIFRLSNDRAVATGLQPRPLSESATDTQAWFALGGRDVKVGLSLERHASILADVEQANP